MKKHKISESQIVKALKENEGGRSVVFSFFVELAHANSLSNKLTKFDL